MHLVKLSIVIPAYNEESSIAEIIKRCLFLKKSFSSIEIVVVNDGSTDNTSRVVQKLIAKNRSIKLINLAVNSGHMAAITAGYKVASGDWIGTIDADGQDDPNIFISMFEQCRVNRADVCFTKRVNRKFDSTLHKIFSPVFYKILSMASKGSTIYQSADFRLISKRVLVTLNSLPEVNKMYRVLIPSLGYKYVIVNYERNFRSAGESKYGFVSLFKLGSKSLLATTGAPLRWVSLVSLVSAFFSLTLTCIALVSGFLSQSPPGWASLAFIVSLMFFLHSVSSMVITEFLLILLSDVRQRPTHQIEKA